MSDKKENNILDDDSLVKVNGGGLISEVGKMFDQIEDQIEDKIQKKIDEAAKRMGPF